MSGWDSASATSTALSSDVTNGQANTGRAFEGVAIELRGVSHHFSRPRSSEGDLYVVDHVDLTIGGGEIVCIVGPSGCGKSTILNFVSGVISPSEGEVHVAGRLVTGINGQTGYVSQQDSLLPWRTVVRNLEVPLSIRHVPRSERRRRARDELARVGLDEFGDYYPHQLSGGMRSRANIARTLVYRPDVLLMDEPFAALDALMRQRLQQQLLDLWYSSPTTIVYVTHDIEEAVVLGNRIVVMTGRPGTVKSVIDVPFGYPRRVADLVTRPQTGRLRARVWSELSAFSTVEDD